MASPDQLPPAQYDPRIAPYILTAWDHTFVANTAFRNWLLLQLGAVPINPGETLVNYVNARLQAAGAAAAQDEQPAVATERDDPADSEDNNSYEDEDGKVEYAAEIVKSEEEDVKSDDGDFKNPAETLNSQQPTATRPREVKQTPHVSQDDPVKQEPSVKQEFTNGIAGTINPANLENPSVSRKQIYQQSLAVPTQPLPEPSNFLRVRPISPQPVVKKSESPELLLPSGAASVSTPFKAPSPPRSTTAPRAAPSSAKPKLNMWLRLQSQIRTQLDPQQIVRLPTRSATRLIELLDAFTDSQGVEQPVPAEARLEILEAMLTGSRASSSASRSYFEAWRDSPAGLNFLETWFKAGAKAMQETWTKEASQVRPSSLVLAKTFLPCAKVWNLIPITLAQLGKMKIGRTMTTISKWKDFDLANPEQAAIHKLCTDISARWHRLLSEETAAKDRRMERDQRERENKRKLETAAEEARKKVKVAPLQPAPPPKTNPPPSSSTLNKPKFGGQALMSMRRIGKNAPTESTTPVGGGEPDAFAAALQMISRGSQPMQVASPATGPSNMTSLSRAGGRRKVRKTVRWRPDAELVAVKEIERAIYDDDVNGPDDSVGDVRTMEQNEGAVLHRERGNIDNFDWVEPKEVMTNLTEDEVRDRQYPAAEPYLPHLGTRSVDLEAARDASAMDVDSEAVVDSPKEPLEESVDETACKNIEHGERLNSDGEFRLELERLRKPQAIADPSQLSQLLSQLTRYPQTAAPVSGGGILTNVPAYNAFGPNAGVLGQMPAAQWNQANWAAPYR